MTDVHEVLRQVRDDAEISILAQGGWLTADQMSRLAQELCAEVLKFWSADGRILRLTAMERYFIRPLRLTLRTITTRILCWLH